MKRKYVKPDVEFVNFLLDEAITAGDLIGGNASAGIGQLPDGGGEDDE